MARKRVTYDEAVILKKIGFNLPVDMKYTKDSILLEEVSPAIDVNHMTEEAFSAPTLNDTRDWLEEKFGYILDTKWNRKDGSFEYSAKWEGHSCAAKYFMETREEALTELIRMTLNHIEVDLNRR